MISKIQSYTAIFTCTILLSGCFFNKDSDKNESSGSTSTGTVSTMPAGTINATFQKAMQSGNVAECSNLSDETEKNRCIESVNTRNAVSSGDANNCKNLPAEKVAACETSIIMMEANKAKDPNLCDKITDETTKKGCKENIIMTKAVSSGSDKDCESLPKERIESCKDSIIQTNVQKQGNEALCDTMQNADRKSTCHDIFNYNQAVTKKDASMCEKISNETQKDTCKKYLSSAQ